MYYYIREAGITDTPWDSDKVFVIAAGDDTVAFVAPEFYDALNDSIMRLTARRDREIRLGLGQIVKEVSSGKFW